MLKGIGFSLLASMLFGYIYYFSTLLLPLSGEDIFGYRVVFTAPFVIAAVFIFRQKYMLIAHLKRIKREPWLLLVFLFNGSMMGFQMWLFLWAPNNGGALSVSLGYLLLPLVLVAAGRIFFKERISPLKFLAIIIAAIGIGFNIYSKGGLSWESLAVCGYAIYFMMRKWFKLNDITSFAIEMVLTLPVCIYFAAQVNIAEVQLVNPHILSLLFLLGLLSGIAFNAYIMASSLLPINVLGLLGYAEPIMMLAVSLFIGENIDAENYPLFLSLMIGMGLIIIDGLRVIQRKTTPVSY
ncbi:MULTISPECIES: EamA family transporter RarD [unclassified Avibacterium]|uniref:EamA family transporter RarD n=1 Tax=unclassified Avibacterium TaxID=2685287 RepID=UPI002025E17D|nr:MULTISPECIES: EamA family transporter RarD [unclassified Avibacterium]MCW9699227.1 EamA family transporter RarD [Avibacterium sp. 20-129]MCW9732894.1 EamA family transporter RarD [Avibacterium sp. 20-15]URL05029.1 EamA family transporter RarD [Avibacterium sp. 20-132]URL06601.1 EamA family transporter RarD [Avibacterium sp. 21-595]